jgi:transposase
LYEAEVAKRPNRCTNPKCGHAIKPHVHSSKTNVIKDIKSEGKIVLIELKIHRYRCPDCKYVFPDEFTFYEKDEHLTKRLKQEFVKRCINGETFRYIANDYSVDGKTVAKAFNDYADAHRDEAVLTYTPIVLGIDEAHIDDHYRLVLTDIHKQKLLDMKKDNKKSTVMAYLRTLDKNVCKCVTMDLAKGYAFSVQKVLPDAVIVIDKFHIIQEINRCVDYVRKDLQNHYRSQGHDIRVFKQSKTLFMINWENLTPQAMTKLNAWFERFPELYSAYMVKETFRDIYATAKTHSQASKMFNDWINAVPDYERFRAMKNTFAERREHILNYWHYAQTNAYTESVNNAIKRIEKAGRGYKFDVLRDRCMLSINNPAPDKFNYKKAVYLKKGEKPIFRKKQEDLYDIAFKFESVGVGVDVKPISAYSRMLAMECPDRMLAYVQAVGRVGRRKG